MLMHKMYVYVRNEFKRKLKYNVGIMLYGNKIMYKIEKAFMLEKGV